MARDASIASKTRSLALSILNRLERRTETLDTLVDNALAHLQMPSRDRRLLYTIVYGVLRWRQRLDWIIAHFSHTPFDEIDPSLLNILRIAAFQIIYLDRIPDAAAVNTAVDMAKSVSRHWAPGYVNGLLRRLAKQHRQVAFPDADSDPVDALSVTKSFPSWLTRRWCSRFGMTKTAALFDRINTIPPITVRANTTIVDRSQLMDELAKEADSPYTTPHSPDGVCFTRPRVPIDRMASFRAGWFQVQDEAAQLAVYLLDPQPTSRVLDACAGLGGKTGHIAALMANKGEVVSLDNSARKLGMLEEEMKRMGFSIVQTALFDLGKDEDLQRIGRFDKALVDAPCSGLGVLRRHPDAKWSSKESELPRYRQRQIGFLGRIADCVRPGGILNYTVCSAEPEETDDVVDAFIRSRKGFTVVHPDTKRFSCIEPFIDRNGALRTYPDGNDMDGFFSVNLKRLC